MKYSALAVTTVAAWSNSVPIENKLPAWQLGNPQGEVDINIFYDVLCPDSRDTHATWEKLFKEDSPVSGKTYGDLVNMRVTPYVLPYHLHSFQIT